jgi:galactokinase
VALVEDASVESFLAAVSADYESRTGLKPNLYVCTAEDGASVLERV